MEITCSSSHMSLFVDKCVFENQNMIQSNLNHNDCKPKITENGLFIRTGFDKCGTKKYFSESDQSIVFRNCLHTQGQRSGFEISRLD